MTKDEIIRKNLDLHAEWMKYVFEHPDVLDRIPKAWNICRVFAGIYG